MSVKRLTAHFHLACMLDPRYDIGKKDLLPLLVLSLAAIVKKIVPVRAHGVEHHHKVQCTRYLLFWVYARYVQEKQMT
jgi:hypothetical protein